MAGATLTPYTFTTKSTPGLKAVVLFEPTG